MLEVAAPVGGSDAGVRLSDMLDTPGRVLGVGDAVPLGTRLMYTPNSGAHDPWPHENNVSWDADGDWTAEAAPYDWLAYRVETSDGGEISTNEAVVALSVRPDGAGPRLSWPSKVRILCHRATIQGHFIPYFGPE